MHLQNGTITHGLPSPPLSTFQFTSPTFHSLILALLTTILAYQSAAIAIDLILGFKPSGQASLTSLSLLHYSTQTSLVSIFAAITKNPKFLLLRYHGTHADMDYCKPSTSNTRISTSTALKLVLLLASAPLLNLLCLLVSLDIDETVSFRDAHFHNLSVGVVDYPPTTTLRNVYCRQFNTRFAQNDLAMAEFLLCISLSLSFRSVKNTNMTFRVETNAQGAVDVQIEWVFNEDGITEVTVYNARTVANIRIGNDLYRVKHSIKAHHLIPLVEEGVHRARRTCDGDVEPNTRIRGASTLKDSDESSMVEMKFYCKMASVRNLSATLREMSSRISLVERGEFQVLPVDGLLVGEKTYGGDLPLVKRRKPPVDFIILIGVVGIIVLLRQVVRWITRNDVDLGVETVMKAWFGIGEFEELLGRKEQVGFLNGKLRLEVHVGDDGYDDGTNEKRKDEDCSQMSIDSIETLKK